MSNAYLDFLDSRRSIRRYTGKMPEDEQLLKILAAACRAPSSKAVYPCSFIVIKQRETFCEIQKFHDKAIALDTAPVAVIVCGDSESSPIAWRDDCAAATMNILYAACAQGLGSCWHGIYPRQHRVEPMKRLLGLPEHIVPYSMVTIGYAENKKAPQQRLDESCIHWDGRW